MTMSPHIVDCADGALVVGATADAGAGNARVRVKKKKDGSWKANGRRIMGDGN